MSWTDPLLKYLLGRKPTISFNSKSPIIQVPVQIRNGDKDLYTSFALDTGASFCVIDSSVARLLELKSSKKTVEIATASGIETAVQNRIPQLLVLGFQQKNTPGLVTDLPEDSGISGLLGLSFLKHYHYAVNHQKSEFYLWS